MNTNLREREHRNIGEDVYEYFQSLTDRVTGGEFQNVSFLSFDSSEPPCPIGQGQFTRLKLTDSSCQITSFENSFIQLEIETNLTFNFPALSQDFIPDAPIGTTVRKLPILFVGFKSGLHAIDHYRFYNSFHAGPLCEQSQAIYESALTYMTKSEEEITNKIQRYAYSEEIDKYKEDIPGVIITYGDLLDMKKDEKYTKTIRFKVNIPYDDFAPLQFFKNYPNSICGDLQLEFKINNNKNMVQYNFNLGDMFDFISRSLTKEEIKNLSIDLNKNGYSFGDFCSALQNKTKQSFTNLGDTGIFEDISMGQISDYKFVCKNIREITVRAGGLLLKTAKSFINCYNIPHDTHEQLRDLLSSTKIYIPAQRIDQYTFSQTPTVSSMNCNTTQSLVNCSALAFTWPRSPNELTCSVNPYMTSIQLQIDNKTYPDKPFSTYSTEHASYILGNLMFDDFFSPNKSLERSLVTNREYKDNTNYLFVVSLERLDSSPFVFEGLTKDNCYITLNGTFDGTYQPYSSLSTRQNPIMFVCQDTLWELSAGDINYYYNDKSIIPRISNN